MKIIGVGHETPKVIITDIFGDRDNLMRSAFVLVLHYYLELFNTQKSLSVESPLRRSHIPFYCFGFDPYVLLCPLDQLDLGCRR